jgi:hypothetical protein
MTTEKVDKDGRVIAIYDGLHYTVALPFKVQPDELVYAGIDEFYVLQDIPYVLMQRIEQKLLSDGWVARQPAYTGTTMFSPPPHRRDVEPWHAPNSDYGRNHKIDDLPEPTIPLGVTTGADGGPVLTTEPAVLYFVMSRAEHDDLAQVVDRIMGTTIWLQGWVTAQDDGASGYARGKAQALFRELQTMAKMLDLIERQPD